MVTTFGVDVTVIVPVRNEESGVRECIQALLDQTVAPHEIVIADGGSTDRTKEIIKEFISAGHSVRLIEDADALPGRGRNLAIEAATTEWIAMTDAGTIARRDWLEKLIVAASADDRVEVGFGSYEPVLSTFFEECLALAFVPPLTRVGYYAFRGPSTASLLIKKSVWERAGRFPEQLRACEDLLFFERVAASGVRVGYAPGAVVDWKMASGARQVFKRFRIYSLHTLRAGLGRSWHLALGRMYAVALALIALSLVHHWAWCGALLVGLGLRVQKSIRQRGSCLKLTHRIGLHTYLLVAALLLLIDLAALTGAFDYVWERVSGGRERAKEMSQGQGVKYMPR